MPEIQKEVNLYEAWYSAGSRLRGPDVDQLPRAIIAAGTVEGPVALAYFWREPETMPDLDERDPSTGTITCHFLSEDYPRVLDLLRNEGPVPLTYRYDEEDRTKGLATFCTYAEEIGESELPWQLPPL